MDGPSFPLSPMTTSLDTCWTPSGFQVAQLWVLIVGESKCPFIRCCTRLTCRSAHNLCTAGASTILPESSTNGMTKKVIDIRVSPPAPSPQLRTQRGSRSCDCRIRSAALGSKLLPMPKNARLGRFVELTTNRMSVLMKFRHSRSNFAED